MKLFKGVGTEEEYTGTINISISEELIFFRHLDCSRLKSSRTNMYSSLKISVNTDKLTYCDFNPKSRRTFLTCRHTLPFNLLSRFVLLIIVIFIWFIKLFHMDNTLDPANDLKLNPNPSPQQSLNGSSPGVSVQDDGNEQDNLVQTDKEEVTLPSNNKIEDRNISEPAQQTSNFKPDAAPLIRQPVDDKEIQSGPLKTNESQIPGNDPAKKSGLEVMPDVSPNIPSNIQPTTPQPSEAKEIVDSSNVPMWDDTQKYIKSLEEKLGNKVLLIYVNMSSSITEGDVDYIYNHVQSIGKVEKLTVLISGPGGSPIAAARIVFMLRKYCKSLEVIVPSIAASAMTMLSLGADRILMGPLSSLSPIDTSIANHQLAPKGNDGYPVRIEVTQLQKFIDLCNNGLDRDKVDDVNKSPYKLLSEHLHPIVIGTIQRMVSLSKMLTSDILKTHHSDTDSINRIVDLLNDEFPTHSYPINYEKAVEIGIKAELMDEDLNLLCLKFLKLVDKLSAGGSSENQGVKVKFTRDAIIESRNLRSLYYNESKYVLSEGKWNYSSNNSRYIVYAPKQNDSGIVKIQAVNPFEL
jgi:hypothetical protein